MHDQPEGKDARDEDGKGDEHGNRAVEEEENSSREETQHSNDKPQRGTEEQQQGEPPRLPPTPITTAYVFGEAKRVAAPKRKRRKRCTGFHRCLDSRNHH
jgi:hypothetical protein